MIFHKTWPLVLSGQKTQTRRPRKETQLAVGGFDPLVPLERVEVIDKIGTNWVKARLLWERGRMYALQPGRGKHAIGRLLLTKIRIDTVQCISYEDLLAEGLTTRIKRTDTNRIDATMDLLEQWENLWNSLYTGTPYTYEKNPLVWVLEFKLAEKYEDRIKAIPEIEWKKAYDGRF